VVTLAVLSVCIVFGIAWFLARQGALPRGQRGSFVQNSFHGNIGYIGLALPLALLIIGASLSFDMVRSRLKAVLSCGLLKLILLPGIGFALYRLFNVMPEAYLPGIILLGSPTATVTYVMAREMQGDSEFAVATISLNTLLSAATYTIWLSIVG
jgi:predicted permease